MHNNPVFLRRLSDDLSKRIGGKTLVRCVSTSPTEIYFQFQDFVLEVVFSDNSTLFLFPEIKYFPVRNTIPQFKECWGKEILNCSVPFPDRVIELNFTDNSTLSVLAFGRNSGIVFQKNREILNRFKLPEHQTLPEFNGVIDLSGNESEILKSNRFLHTDWIREMKEKGFFDTLNDREKVWNSFLNELSQRPVCISPEPKLDIVKNRTECAGELFHDSVSAIQYFSKQFLSVKRFNRLFTSINNELTKRKKNLEDRIRGAKIKLEKTATGNHYRELADILMANLHVDKPEGKSISVFNFYTNKPIEIKINKDLSLQKNAEVFYRKARNQHKEIEHLELMLAKMLDEISVVQKHLEVLNKSHDLKTLQSLSTEIANKSETKKPVLPYKVFTCDDFEIRVGKNAQSNDKLLKSAGRFDIWLHARNTSGSHVIIRNPSNETIPEHVLEYAAALAAGHSGNQHEGLAAVIHTPVKYVRKFKGALPGQVKVDREEVILIEPKKV
ncbi:MAG: DUF814 domain-containing protein [Bacteroidetes bacterium]|nr:DUF814 domain-containing protein [Bacteroidota bacterium]